MSKVFEGKLSGEGRRFGIVVSRFNEFISLRLLEGAMDCLRRHGAKDEDITVVWVPGAFDVPVLAKRMGDSRAFDAILCLGAVIRGDTPHFDFVASEAAKGVAYAGMHTGVPTVFGIVTADTLEQAIERAGAKAGNKGWDSAESAMELADLYARMG